jgi:hypothetical protein
MMTARNFRGIGYTVGALALLLAVPAHAGIGDGIRLGGGDGVLHPFVEIGGKYDSNVYAVGTVGSPEAGGDLIFQIRPGLKLDVPGDMVAVDARAAIERVQYAGLGENTASISGWWGDAGLRLSVNPKGRVAFELREAFRRSNQVQALSLTTPALANYNMLSATVPFMPGGGALVFALGGDWAVEAYEPLGGSGFVCPTADPACNTESLKHLGYSDLQGRGSVIWKFLPRTQATLDIGYSKRIPTDTAASPEIGTFRAQAGVSGLVTTQFGATLRAGYGAASGTGVDFGTWLATVEAEWMPVAEASVKASWSHGLGTEPGSLYAVYSMNRVAADAQYKVARRYTAKLGVRYDAIAYQVTGNDTTSNVLQVEPSLRAEVSKWLFADLGYTFTKRSSVFSVADPLLVKPETFDFTRSVVYLRASVIY